MSRTSLIRLLHGRSRRKLSRRDFLLGTGAGALSAALPYQVSAAAVKVGILGGGAAGMAAAYELNRRGVPFKLFEASSRLGGRVFTLPKWNEDGQFIELGGELINSIDTETLWLCKRLGLATQKYADGEGNAALTETLIQAGGQVYTEEELVAALGDFLGRVALLKREAFGDFDGNFNYKTARQLPKAAEFDQQSLAEMLDGLAKYTQPWCLEALRGAYEAEYGIAADQMSSLNFLTMIDTDLSDGFNIFGESDETIRIKGGNSAVIQAIGRRLPTTKVATGRAVTTIERQSSSFRCQFSGGGSEAFTHLIVAVPLTQLRKIAGWEKLGFSKVKLEWMNNLAMGLNAKTMVGFEQRFWRGIQGGPVPANRGGIFLSPTSGAVWETSRLQTGSRGILTHYTTGAHAVEDHDGAIAKQRLAAVYGDNLPDFKAVAHFNWPRHGWTEGSFSALKVGQYSAFWGAGGEAECGGRLVFAGEHTSEKSQGFINGGFETGLRAARQIIQALRG